MLSFTKLKDRWYQGLYQHVSSFDLTRSLLKDTHVIDENQSVKWNREEVAKRNSDIRNQIEVITLENNAKTDKFYADLFDACSTMYDINIEQFDIIKKFVLQDYCGEYNYPCTELIEYFEDFLITLSEIKEAGERK